MAKDSSSPSRLIMPHVSINPIYDEATIAELMALYHDVTMSDHIQQQLLANECNVPTSFENSTIGIVSDVMSFTHCTPCYIVSHDPPSDISKEILDDSLINFMFGLDDSTHVHIDSPPSQTTTIAASHASPISDNASHDPSHTSSHTPSHYVDDPIDDTLNDIFISESLSDFDETIDSHESTTLHTTECESLTPLSSSSE
ncbi:hypothetical protein KI387_026740, partial [Taxus chinensis]